jgi:beta-glucanase (GH16 family)
MAAQLSNTAVAEPWITAGAGGRPPKVIGVHKIIRGEVIVALKRVGAAAAAAVVAGALVLAIQHDNASAGTQAAMAPATSNSAYHLVWSDDFNGSKLSSKYWVNQPIGAGSGRSCASASTKMIKVSGGTATFSADVNKSRAGTADCAKNYLNSQVKSTKTFLYGKFSARIKFQSPRGMHGSFWLLPSGPTPGGVSSKDLPGYQGVEVDVAEYFGDLFGSNPKGGLYSYIYYPKKAANGSVAQVKQPGNTKKASQVVGKKLASGGYHTYTMEWTPTAYTFYVDGTKTATLKVGISHRPELLRLSMLTSDWELPRLTSKSTPAGMQVDWVRIYQK